MTKLEFGVLTACLAALLANGAHADNHNDASIEEAGAPLSEIVVTAARYEQSVADIPGALSVVSGADVQVAQQQLGLDEALAAVPGVFFQNRFNFAQDLRIAIRGFGARSNFGVRGIKILIDGIPETLADGQSQVDSIDLASVGQVEVLRGAASSIYGNAAGGVIHVRSELGGEPAYIETRLAGGDYGYRKQQVKATGELGRLSFLVSLSDLKIDGFRAHSEAENTQLNSRFRYQIDEHSTLNISLSATDQPVSNDPGGVTQAQALADPKAARDRNVEFAAGEALDQNKLGASYTRRFSNGGQFVARYYALRRDFQSRLPFANGGVIVFDRLFSGAGLSYQQDVRIAGVSHQLISGIDYDRQRDDRQRFDNLSGITGGRVLDQLERIDSAGFFVRDQMTLTERLQLSVGLRYDRIEFAVGDRFLDDGNDSGTRTIEGWSPSAGFVYTLNPSHTVYGNVSTAFQTPTSTEFARPDGGGGFNAEPEPEESVSYEIGLRGRIANVLDYDVTGFAVDLDDELIPFEVASNPGRDFFANAGRSTRRGLEWTLSAEPLAGLRMMMSYTWSRFRFDRFVDDNGNDFAGNTSPGIPENFAFAKIGYRHSSGFYAALDVLYTDDLFADNANNVRVSGATLTNMRLGWRRTFGSFTLEPFIGVNNATDQDFTANTRINAFGGRHFEAGPGRNGYGGISFRFHY